MSKLNKYLEMVQKNGGNKSINNMILKQKFSKLFVLMRDKENLTEVRKGLHASSIIVPDEKFCLRQQVLSLLFEMDQGEELPVNLLQIFAAGESIHEKWQSMIEKCSGKKGNSIKLIKNEARSYNEEFELFYTPDSIVEIDNVPYIIEYKSMNTIAYSSGIKLPNPHPSARKQIQLYMLLTGIEDGIILLEDKNTQDFSVFKVKFNYREVLPFIERLYDIKNAKNEYLEDGILPKRCCKNSFDERANNCSMRSACYNLGKYKNGKDI